MNRYHQISVLLSVVSVSSRLQPRQIRNCGFQRFALYWLFLKRRSANPLDQLYHLGSKHHYRDFRPHRRSFYRCSPLCMRSYFHWKAPRSHSWRHQQDLQNSQQHLHWNCWPSRRRNSHTMHRTLRRSHRHSKWHHHRFYPEILPAWTSQSGNWKEHLLCNCRLIHRMRWLYPLRV